MKSRFVVYNTFAHFEVVLAANFLRYVGEVKTVGPSADPVTSQEKFRILPDLPLDHPEAAAGDILVIAGGQAAELDGREDLWDLIRRYDAAGKAVAAICGGPVHLARAGILDGRRYTTSIFNDGYPEFPPGGFTDEDLTIDGRIITAKPNAYVDFALEIGSLLDIYDDEDDYIETVEFFREFKDVGD